MTALYTIGHSTRSIDELIELLHANAIALVVDVRAMPRSRRHPHFSGTSLDASLRGAGISYEHAPALGGLRTPLPDSRHTGWREPGFRGFADYMDTGKFAQALDRVLDLARTRRLALLCAEKDPLQCHRQLISDAALLRGVSVWHIVDGGPLVEHRRTRWAEAEGDRLSYAEIQGRLEPES